MLNKLVGNDYQLDMDITMLKDIYFLDVKKLTEELQKGSFSEVRTLKHLIVTAVLGGIAFEYPVYIDFSESEVSLWQGVIGLLTFILSAVITYYGLWLTYQTNQKGDGKDFFLRLAALMLPIGLRLAIYFLVAGITLAILATGMVGALGAIGAVVSLILMLVAVCAFYGLFYVQLRNHIAIVSGYEAREAS